MKMGRDKIIKRLAKMQGESAAQAQTQFHWAASADEDAKHADYASQDRARAKTARAKAAEHQRDEQALADAITLLRRDGSRLKEHNPHYGQPVYNHEIERLQAESQTTFAKLQPHALVVLEKIAETRDEQALIAGVTPVTVVNWAKGASRVPAENIRAILEAVCASR